MIVPVEILWGSALLPPHLVAHLRRGLHQLGQDQSERFVGAALRGRPSHDLGAGRHPFHAFNV